MRWFPKEDLVLFDISELNFAKKCRGKKPSKLENIILANITRRHCVSKVSEIFDLDWQDHTNNSNNELRFAHTGKKRS